MVEDDITLKTREDLERYKADPPRTSREKAIAERALWESLDPSTQGALLKKGGNYNANWLKSVLGEDTTVYIARDRILRAERNGMPVDAIWAYLDGGGSPSQAVKILTEARIAYQEEISAMSAKGLGDVLAQDQARRRCIRAIELMISGERPVRPVKRKEKSSPDNETPKDTPKRPSEAPAKRTKSIEDILVGIDGDDSKDLWQKISTAIVDLAREFTQERLKGLESESVIEDILNTYKNESHAVFQDFLLNIRKARRGAQGALDARREDIREALEVLRIPVQRGWRKEDLNSKAIKKAYREMSARFHPDRNPGNEQISSRYLQIQEAYTLLKEYLTL